MGKFVDLTGKRFGRLTVIGLSDERSKDRGRKFICKCDCGNMVLVRTADLNNGNTRSCGCLNRELVLSRTRKHGKTDTRIHRIWCDMRRRCYVKSRPFYDNYGGRGIIVCDEWLGADGFINFYKWSMENGYRDDLSIDRIDNDGPYAPWNCRWADELTQKNNTRANIYLTYNGETHTLAEWARIKNIRYDVLYLRIHRLGWNVEDALEKVPRKMSRKKCDTA